MESVGDFKLAFYMRFSGTGAMIKTLLLFKPKEAEDENEWRWI
jgi:hypothetical protein